MKVKAYNMTTPQGNTNANQIIVNIDDERYFQSYGSVIACIHADGSIVLSNKFWDYSSTTSKYRNRFLRLTTAETKAKIQSGEIQLADLN